MQRHRPLRRTMLRAINRKPSSHIPLEHLETRRLLSTFQPVACAADSVTGNTLRAAIIAANSNGQNNTICLKAGTYKLGITNTAGQENYAQEGDLDITCSGHTLTIVGQGSDKTFIKAQGIDRVFQVFPGVTLVLKNLAIAGGVARDCGAAGQYPGTSDSFGGGVLINGADVSFQNVLIKDNAALGGGGLLPGIATLTPVAGVWSAYGGGIYSDTSVKLCQTTIRNNQAIGGDTSGIFVTDSTTSSATTSSVVNLASGDAYGGGIYVGSGLLCGTGLCVRDNEAIGGNGAILLDGAVDGNAYGGGIYADSLKLTSSEIRSNTAQGGDGGFSRYDCGDGGLAYGGGIYVNCTGCISKSYIACNSAIGGDGASILDSIGDFTSASEQATTTGIIGLFGGSGGSAFGGGVYFRGSKLDITCDTTVIGNRALGGDAGSGVLVPVGVLQVDGNVGGGGQAHGGGIAVQSNYADVLVSSSTVTNNLAQGGVGFVSEVALAKVMNGTAKATSTTTTTDGQILPFADGAAYGGGISVEGYPIIRTPEVQSSTDDGDSVDCDGPYLKLANSFISWNTANGGDGAVGTSIPTSTSTTTLVDGIDSNGSNGANAEGGGIYITYGSLDACKSSLANNTAKGGDGADGLSDAPTGGFGGDGGNGIGGGISAYSANVNLSRVNFWYNSAQGGDGGNGGSGTDQGGGGGGGGTGAGGAFAFGGYSDGQPIWIGVFSCVQISGNEAVGGNGGDGGDGATLGGSGGSGGDAFGGGIVLYGQTALSLSGTKVTRNRAEGGNGGNGGTGTTNGTGGFGGDALGGGIAVFSPATLLQWKCTSAFSNCVIAGKGGTPNGVDGIAVCPDIYKTSILAV